MVQQRVYGEYFQQGVVRVVEWLGLAVAEVDFQYFFRFEFLKEGYFLLLVQFAKDQLVKPYQWQFSPKFFPNREFLKVNPEWGGEVHLD
ncbi:hypothetical protein SDC9_120064 [bioreactor metagenome]|uniref:Uncharacterized protein n=1 Tax=bioreactor metagenome TaxID=1076179 RepID=A0A645C6U1_9ZZZZ